MPVTLQFYDLEKCFDRLWLRKCMVSLWESGVGGPGWILIYEMNKIAEIVVETPMGVTEAFQINKVVMQGTVMATIMCAKLIDTAKEIAETGGDGIQHGEVRIPTQMFQDDILQQQNINKSCGGQQTIWKCKQDEVQHAEISSDDGA